MIKTHRVFPFIFVFCVFSSYCEKFEELSLGHQYYNFSIEGSLVAKLYRVMLNTKNPPPAIRVSVSSLIASQRNPLTVTVIRGQTIHNIALSRVQSQQGKRFEYWFASDTLCDYENSIEELGKPVQLSIASSLPSLFDLRVDSVDDFHIGHLPFKSIVSPSEPQYYLYTFPDNVEKVDVRIISNTEICARLITRQANCPLFDFSGLLELSEAYFYQSFTKFGGFPLQKSKIGSKFHLAFAVISDDSACGTPSESSEYKNEQARTKEAMISVTPVSEDSVVALIPLIVFGISIIVVLVLTYLQYKWLDKCENNEPSIFDGNDSEGNVIVDRVELFDEPTNIVSHKAYEKQRLVKESKYFNFLFFQIFGSVLPALTTLFQNRQHISDKMNLDTCYLNYLCSSDFFGFNSINAMTSASSLALLGVLNLIIVFRKKIFKYEIPRPPTTHGIQQREAPKVVCMLGLIAMGLLWTITSNCPHKTTLHLEAYTSVWVCYATCFWIYSKRHGVRKWQQFFVIAISSALGCITLAENMFDMNDCGQTVLKLLFLATAVSSTGYFCFNYYYERPQGLPSHQWISNPWKTKEVVVGDNNCMYRPLKSKIWLIVISMMYSIISSLTLFFIPNQPIFSTCTLLGKGQVAIYLIYYICQKIRFEKSSFTLNYKLVLTLLTVSAFSLEGVSRFLANVLATFDDLMTPAMSRELNTECLLPGIDWNDIRHYNCAFDSFLFILLIDFIDSNIKGVPKKNIFVF